MAYDGSGGYDLPAGQPVVTGTTISSTTHNNLANDMATAFDTAFCRDGQAAATAPFDMGGFRIQNMGAATGVGHAVIASQVQNAGLFTLSSVSGTNVITGSATPTPAAYAAGQAFEFTPANTNTGATTLNVSSLGAKNIFFNGAACVGGEIIKNVPIRVKYDGTQFNIVGGIARMPPKYIQGLTYSNNGSDATNDIDIAAGACVDATGALDMVLSATLTKRLDAAWAVGTNQGGLDTGSIGNSDYYIWLIKRSDTGVVDALFSTSATAPTMPTNYDYKRLIGWFKRVGGTIVAFHAYETDGGGIEHKWDSPTLDVDLANTLTTSRRTDAIKVPLNFSVIALIRFGLFDTSSAFRALICCPDETDQAPSTVAAPLSTMFQASATAGDGSTFSEMEVRTSATGTIAARADLATVDQYRVVTLGFRWARRN